MHQNTKPRHDSKTSATEKVSKLSSSSIFQIFILPFLLCGYFFCIFSQIVYLLFIIIIYWTRTDQRQAAAWRWERERWMPNNKMKKKSKQHNCNAPHSTLNELFIAWSYSNKLIKPTERKIQTNTFKFLLYAYFDLRVSHQKKPYRSTRSGNFLSFGNCYSQRSTISIWLRIGEFRNGPAKK